MQKEACNQFFRLLSTDNLAGIEDTFLLIPSANENHDVH